MDAVDDGASSRVLTWPNLISAVRLALVPVFAVLLGTRRDGAALAVLAVAGASDWLDGVLARRLRQVSELGRLLDPAADRLFILVAILAMAVRGVVPWWLVAALLARDLLLGVVQLVVMRAGWAPLQVHVAGKGGTMLLLYAFPLLLAAQLVGGPAGAVLAPFGWAAALWGTTLYWTSGVLYLGQARSLLGARAH